MVENALSVILMNPKVRSVLINVFGGITRGDEVAKGVITARDHLKMKLPLVVRLSGTNEEEGRKILKENGIEPGVIFGYPVTCKDGACGVPDAAPMAQAELSAMQKVTGAT